MKIVFDTSEYRNVHGKQPRGFGNWGFDYEGVEFWHTGAYGEARKLAEKYFRSLKYRYSDIGYVTVLP